MISRTGSRKNRCSSHTGHCKTRQVPVKERRLLLIDPNVYRHPCAIQACVCYLLYYIVASVLNYILQTSQAYGKHKRTSKDGEVMAAFSYITLHLHMLSCIYCNTVLIIPQSFLLDNNNYKSLPQHRKTCLTSIVRTYNMQLSLILVCELAYMCVAMSVHVEMGLSYWLSPLKCLDWYLRKQSVSGKTVWQKES